MHPILLTRSPSVSPPISGAERRKVDSAIVLVNEASGVYTAPTPTFRIVTPSVRLVVLWALTFDADVSPAPSGLGAFKVTADAYVRGSREQGGTLMRANNIITSIALPWSLNLPMQGIDQVVGSVVVPNLPGTNIAPCKLWLTAIWEPAPGDDIPDAQLQQLLNLCHVATTSGGTATQTGAP